MNVIRHLTRKGQDRQRLRELLLEGAESASDRQADAAYFADLRARAVGIDRD